MYIFIFSTLYMIFIFLDMIYSYKLFINFNIYNRNNYY